VPTKSGIARLGVQAGAGLLGLLGIAVVVTAGGAAAVVAWPTVASTPASSVVAPTPSEQQRVCPGPLLNLAEDSSQAHAATSVGQAAAVYGARTGATDSAAIRPHVSKIKAVDNSASDQADPPLLLSVPVKDGESTAPLVAGSQSQTAATETIGGLAVAACAEAASDSWLVGGSTDVGRTSLVLLSNPTTVLATVNLNVSGEVGAVDAPGSTGILVQPGTQRVVALAGLAPNLKSPVVHVQSRGGQVAASLEQSSIRGIVPDGVELLGPSTGPALEQVIAGVRVTTAATAAASATGEGFSEDTPSVRILVPGDEPATVQLGVTSATDDAAGTSLQVEVQPGIATEVPLPGLTPGSFAVRLTSDQPIVSAARTVTAGGSAKDFAWHAASDAVRGDFMVSVAAGPAPTLHLVNTARRDAVLRLTPENGDPRKVTVPAGQPADLSLTAGARYAVTGGTSIVASVGYAGDGLLSSFTINPAGPLAAKIRVYAH